MPPPTVSEEWYFAYGSNMSAEQCRIRIGDFQERLPACLLGYYLIANKPGDLEGSMLGYMNIMPVNGKVDDSTAAMCSPVFGVAYRITKDQLLKMDTFEYGYERRLLECTLGADPQWVTECAPSSSAGPTTPPRGTHQMCWAYIAQQTGSGLTPSKEYLARVVEGRDVLPQWYSAALESMPTNPLPSPRQALREQHQL